MTIIVPLLILLSKYCRHNNMDHPTSRHHAASAGKPSRCDQSTPTLSTTDRPPAGEAAHKTVIDPTSPPEKRPNNQRSRRSSSSEQSQSGSSDSDITSSRSSHSTDDRRHHDRCQILTYHRCRTHGSHCHHWLNTPMNDWVPINRHILNQLLNNLHQQSKFNRRLISRHLDIFEDAISGYQESERGSERG